MARTKATIGTAATKLAYPTAATAATKRVFESIMRADPNNPGEEVHWSSPEPDASRDIVVVDDEASFSSHDTRSTTDACTSASEDDADADLPSSAIIANRSKQISKKARLDQDLAEDDRAEKAKQAKEFQVLSAKGLKLRRLRAKWIRDMMAVLDCDWPTAFKHSQKAINKGILPSIDRATQRRCGKIRGNCTFKDVTVEERLLMYDVLVKSRGASPELAQ